jgi:hypothetical protein
MKTLSIKTNDVLITGLKKTKIRKRIDSNVANISV